jgi:LmbE family N-acetylglucosaminyl deacetylase
MVSLKKKTLLIIAPHPDDEVIGCAGLIQKVKKDGGKVFVLFLTVGNTRDFTKKGLSTEAERKKEIEKVAVYLNYDDYDISFPGNKYHLKLDTLGQKALMDEIERESSVALERVRPDIVAFPSASSYNQDHKIAANAALASLRPASPTSKHFVSTVISFEEVADNWTIDPKFTPNYFEVLSDLQLEKKLSAVKLYASQYRPTPSTRSGTALKALSILRGVQSGNKYSEGFFIHRILQP